ncbi:MAG: carboxypeptidase regulatory-like domain-containing protein [Planctomycetota bacterium]
MTNRLGFVFFPCLLLLFLHSGIAPAAAQEENQQAKAKYASETGTFRLKIVGPKGEPIPGAKIDLRFSPRQTLEIVSGSSDGDHRYGKSLAADDQGVLELKLPEQPLERISAGIRCEGYGPFWAQWELKAKSERLPVEYVANLDKGQSFGGIIVDEQGKPVVGAKVHPRIEYKKRESDLSQLASGRSYTTDSEGRWSIHIVPGNEVILRLAITHPKFKQRTENLKVQEFGLKDGAEPNSKIVLSRGLSITGTIRDKQGKPIQGAVVRARVNNRTLQSTSNAEGQYEVTNLEEGTVEFVAMGQTFAPELQTVTVRPDPEDVNFELGPGKELRVLVTDKAGKPIQGARVFFQDWRGSAHYYELDKVLCYTDENGEWIWKNAPADEIRVDICPPGEMQLPNQYIQAGEENEFVSVPLLRIRGLVVDAETGRKVENFRVIPGRIWPGRQEPFWTVRDSFDGSEGSFVFEESRVDGQLVLKIEGEGYAPLVSRAIAWNEGRVGLALKMKEAAPTDIQVLGPNGTPVKGADIALGVKGSQISLNDGAFDSSTFADRLKTNEQGIFRLQPQSAPLVLFICHEAGFLAHKFEPKNPIAELQLDPWATIKGKVLHGEKAASGVKVSVSPNRSYLGPDLPSPTHTYRSVTKDDGMFEFRRVVPGALQLAERVEAFRSSQGMKSAYSNPQSLSVAAGETLEVNIGGGGHRLTGKFVMPKDFKERYDWEFSMPELHLDVMEPQIPFPQDLSEQERQAWLATWRQTEAGKQWQAASRRHFDARFKPFRTHVKQDGSFDFHNIPPGKYLLEIKLAKPAMFAEREGTMAYLETSVVVPDFEQPYQTKQLGELELKPVAP